MKTIADAIGRIKNTLSMQRERKLNASLARMDSTLARVDAEFKEEDHPRSEDGKFGSKSGGKSKTRKTAKYSKSPIEKVIASKDSQEKAWHEGLAAWNEAPPEIVDAMAKTAKLTRIEHNPHDGCWYRPGSHEIQMGYPINMHNDLTVAIWRHEFGHAMDFNGSTTAQSAACKPMMEYDTNSSVKYGNIYSIYDSIMTRKRGKSGEKFRSVEGLMISDFVCALTNGRFGYGHSPAYFSEPGKRECEMFANYVSLISGPKGGEYRALLHDIAPASCRAFDGIIKKMGGKKSYLTKK